MGMTDEISVSCHSRVSVLACIGNYSADDLQEALFHNFQAFQILKHRSRKETLWPAPQSISIQSLLVRHVFCELGPASCCLHMLGARAMHRSIYRQETSAATSLGSLLDSPALRWCQFHAHVRGASAGWIDFLVVITVGTLV